VPRILIVDDQAHVRAALVAALQANGFEVVAIGDAISAMAQFEARRFDLAIVDVYMPNIDGVKLIKALRELSPGLPIIAMSGVLLNESQRTALEFLPKLPGMSEVVCLQKPFRPPELLKAVRVAFAMAA
jgi:CheY-like chemotaxis protein